MTKKQFILNYLILKIQSEEYDHESFLPSIRFLANKFKVSSNTIQAIYRELKSLNYIKSIPKSGYTCNQDFIFNLWRTKHNYNDSQCCILGEQISKKFKHYLELSGNWTSKYCHSEKSWLSLVKLHFPHEKSDINLPLKKLLTYYSKPITKIEIDIKGIPQSKNHLFEKYLPNCKNGFILESISYFAYDELVAELLLFQPTDSYTKKISSNIL